MKRGAALACFVVGLVCLLASGVEAGTHGPVFRGPFGSGAGAVWIVSPRGPPRSIVVFLHGWKVAPPSWHYRWLGQFLPWIDHLVARGSAVLFPAYQTGLDAEGPVRVVSLRHGIVEGFRHLPRPIPPVIVAGYSYGASLGFYYAADARAWRLPEPVAVDAVFPAGPIPGVQLPELARRIEVLIEVGDEDSVAGRGGADAFWAWLSARREAQQRLVVVHSSRTFAAVHAAPKLTTPSARKAFWFPLDRLVARALQR